MSSNQKFTLKHFVSFNTFQQAVNAMRNLTMKQLSFLQK